jgi:serine/threonine-protein kinase HipA
MTMTSPRLRVLDVALHGSRIGVMTEVAPDVTVFAFDAAYIDQPNRPVLSLSFKSETGNLMTEIRQRRSQVDPFFSNLLPEGPLRQYLATRVRVHPTREFYLLAALGQDLPGALTITPSDPDLFTGMADVLSHDRSFDSPPHPPLRFSLAGIQLKFSATQSQDKQGGLTIPVGGVGGEWIVKLPASQHDGVPENEYSMMSLARELGMQVPELRLIDTGDIGGFPEDIARLNGPSYAIRRFDRGTSGPTHMEDLAQIFGHYPNEKYERASVRRIAKLLAIETTDDTVREFIRRVTFSVLIGNGDMHLKNWSLTYPDRRTPTLAPAYDFVSTIPYLPGDQFALPFDRARRFTDFTPAEMRLVAAKAHLSEPVVLRTIRDTIDHFMTLWPTRKASLPLHTTVIRSIDAHLASLPAVQNGFRS